MGGNAPKRRKVVQQQQHQQQHQQQQHRTSRTHAPSDQLVWAKLAPELPWWPARLAAPDDTSRGPTVAIEVLGTPSRAEILRVQRRRVDCNFRGNLRKHAEPWKRRKCTGIKRAFSDALAHARQILAGAHARCAQCGTWHAVPHEHVAADWSCPGGCEPGDRSGATNSPWHECADNEGATSRPSDD